MKIRIIIALLSLTILSSCRKDDPPQTTELSGSWNLVQLHYQIMASDALGTQANLGFTDIHSHEEMDYNVTFGANTFNASGNYSLNYYQDTPVPTESRVTYTDIEVLGTYGLESEYRLNLSSLICPIEFHGLQLSDILTKDAEMSFSIDGNGKLHIGIVEEVTQSIQANDVQFFIDAQLWFEKN